MDGTIDQIVGGAVGAVRGRVALVPWVFFILAAIITFAVLGGVALSFAPIDPMKALVWSAVINGVAAVPIMAVTMVVATSKKIMSHYTATPSQRVFGWLATAAMGAASIGMVVLMLV